MRKVGLGVVVGALLSTLTIAPASAGVPSSRCDRPGTISLDDRANGRHLRVCKGARLTVVLHAPDADSPDTWWQPITTDGRAIQPDPYHPHILPARGVTVGFFRASHHGEATLRSTRRVCPTGPTGPTCHAVLSWQVDVAI
jgi:hypothetical protein